MFKIDSSSMVNNDFTIKMTNVIYTATRNYNIGRLMRNIVFLFYWNKNECCLADSILGTLPENLNKYL